MRIRTYFPPPLFLSLSLSLKYNAHTLYSKYTHVFIEVHVLCVQTNTHTRAYTPIRIHGDRISPHTNHVTSIINQVARDINIINLRSTMTDTYDGKHLLSPGLSLIS